MVLHHATPGRKALQDVHPTSIQGIAKQHPRCDPQEPRSGVNLQRHLHEQPPEEQADSPQTKAGLHVPPSQHDKAPMEQEDHQRPDQRQPHPRHDSSNPLDVQPGCNFPGRLHPVGRGPAFEHGRVHVEKACSKEGDQHADPDPDPIFRLVTPTSLQPGMQVCMQPCNGRITLVPGCAGAEGEALPRHVPPGSRGVKKSVVDHRLIRQELHGTQSQVMKVKGAPVLLDGYHPLPGQPHHGRGKCPVVKPDRTILDAPEITQGGRGIPCRGLLFRNPGSLLAVHPQKQPGHKVVAHGPEEDYLAHQ